MKHEQAEKFKIKFDKCKNVFNELQNLLNNKSVYDVLDEKYKDELENLDVCLDNLEVSLNSILCIIECLPEILSILKDEEKYIDKKNTYKDLISVMLYLNMVQDKDSILNKPAYTPKEIDLDGVD